MCNVQGGYGQQPPNRYGQPGAYGQQPPPQGYQQPQAPGYRPPAYGQFLDCDASDQQAAVFNLYLVLLAECSTFHLVTRSIANECRILCRAICLAFKMLPVLTLFT